MYTAGIAEIIKDTFKRGKQHSDQFRWFKNTLPSGVLLPKR